MSGLGTNGCGSSGSSGNSGGGGGTYVSALTSCSDYCDAYAAAACSPPKYTDDVWCKVNECTPIPTMASADCYSATKTWYDCRKAQSNICGDAGCTTQAAAALSACPPKIME